MARNLVALLAVTVLLGVAHPRLLVFQNNLPQTLWVGALGKAGKAAPNNGGWTMYPGQQVRVNVEETWAGRFWARTGCQFDNSGYGFCETGDCSGRLRCLGAAGAPPATLAEFTLYGWQGQDTYDVSNVEGFNVPIQITPLAAIASPYNPYRCGAAGCRANLLPNCPSALRQYSRSGRVIGCKSACIAFNADHFCCRGLYASAQNCDPARWPVNYPAYFKGACPGAFSYSFDNATSTFSCAKNGYRINFG
ncbi:uncharacterized protein [Periplaneta americana]|uniref:uncharacterized protein n=1 Tax=Periplaneta americana TaxID=6978 RepID=UPI0037E8DDC4